MNINRGLIDLRDRLSIQILDKITIFMKFNLIPTCFYLLYMLLHCDEKKL